MATAADLLKEVAEGALRGNIQLKDVEHILGNETFTSDMLATISNGVGSSGNMYPYDIQKWYNSLYTNIIILAAWSILVYNVIKIGKSLLRSDCVRSVVKMGAPCRVSVHSSCTLVYRHTQHNSRKFHQWIACMEAASVVHRAHEIWILYKPPTCSQEVERRWPSLIKIPGVITNWFPY